MYIKGIIEAEEESKKIDIISGLVSFQPLTLQAKENEVIFQYKRDTYYNTHYCTSINQNIPGIDYITIIEAEELEEVDDEENIIGICADCQDIIYVSDDAVRLADGDIVCRGCYEDSYFYCSCCDEVYHNDEAVWTASGDAICDGCYSNWYFTCEGCNEVYHNDDAFIHNDCYYCEDCYNELEEDDEEDEDVGYNAGNLQGYHEHSRNYTHILKVSDADNMDETIGTELETERNGSRISRTDFCTRLDNKFNQPIKHIHFERDSSLDDGVEIISEPMTLEYWNTNKNKIFRDIVAEAHSLGYRSHNGGNCGLHVHFNKKFFGTSEAEQQEKINTLLLFFETYQDEITKISRRERFSYCEFLSRTNYTLRDIRDEKIRSKIACSSKFINRQKIQTGHGDAVNINASTGKTFEIRIMRGTLKPETFIACIEFCINLIKCIQKEKPADISFSKVVNYLPTLYLKDYIREREIKANYKKLKDYTEQCENLSRSIKTKVERAERGLIKKLDTEIKVRTRNLKNIDTHAVITDGLQTLEEISRNVNNIKTLICSKNDLENNHYYDARDNIQYNYKTDNFSISEGTYEKNVDEFNNILRMKKVLEII